MKPIELTSQFQSPLPSNETLNFLASPRALILFDGYGLVPGIVKVKTDGAERILTSATGKVWREKILIKNDNSLWIEIYPEAPEKIFYRSISERFLVEDNGQGSIVQRRMVVTCRTGTSLFGRWGASMLDKAIAKNNQKLAAALGELPQSGYWL